MHAQKVDSPSPLCSGDSRTPVKRTPRINGCRTVSFGVVPFHNGSNDLAILPDTTDEKRASIFINHYSSIHRINCQIFFDYFNTPPIDDVKIKNV